MPTTPSSLQAVKDLLGSQLADHPRLLLSAAGEEAVRRRLKTDERLAKLWKRRLANADAFCAAKPVERVVEGRRLLAVSREVLHRVLSLGLAFRIMQERRYFEAARKVMLDAAAFSDWNPSHFLDVGEMTAALAIGYDWFFGQLSNDDRGIIRGAILDKGVRTSLDTPHGWINATNNWNPVCHAGMALGALAVAENEIELCAQVVARAVDNVPIAMRHYAPDGAYPEGAMYWSYGTNFNVLLIAALESALGSDFGLSDQPGFLASADYIVHVTAPSGKFFDYADCREGGGYEPSVGLTWMAARRKEPSLVYVQSRRIDAALANREITPDREHERLSPLYFVWSAAGEAAPPKKLSYVAGGDMPVGCHRSSWDKDATYVGIKGGSPSVSHGHMDVGSFVVESQGQRWAWDLGMQDYHSLESIGVNLWNGPAGGVRWTIFRLGAASHNILTVGGADQVVDGHAPILRSGEDFTIVDCGPVYRDQLHASVRGARLYKDGVVRIQDEIEAMSDRAAPIRWAMLTRAAVSIEADGSALLTLGGRRLRLRAAGGERFEVFAKDPQPKPYDAPNPGVTVLGFRISLAARERRTVAVDFLPGEIAAVPPVAALSHW